MIGTLTRVSLVALLAVAVLPSCETAHRPSRSDKVAAVDPVTGSAVRTRSGPRVSEDVLSDNGLRTIWYDDGIYRERRSPHQVGIDAAYIVDGNFFIVTRPAPSQDRRYFKRVDPDSGLTVWTEYIDEPLEHAPSVYRYPTGVRKPAELYYTIGDTVYCLDLDNGLELWHADLKFPV